MTKEYIPFTRSNRPLPWWLSARHRGSAVWFTGIGSGRSVYYRVTQTQAWSFLTPIIPSIHHMPTVSFLSLHKQTDSATELHGAHKWTTSAAAV